jgi:hypothetical protein
MTEALDNGSPTPATELPAKVARVNNISFVPFKIRMYCKEVELASGTAFLYLFEGKHFFVTNWHNVTGREPGTHKCKSPDLALPDRIKADVPYWSSNSAGVSVVTWSDWDFPLYEDADNTIPIWFEHPTHGGIVDAVAFPVSEAVKTAIVPANDPKLNLLNTGLYPGLDVFILGYPRGLSGGGGFSLWKRGSLASEPDLDLDELPKMYVDTATREGMSGSPVYTQEVGVLRPENPPPGVSKESVGKGKRFLGIYSGRVGNDTFLAQLGIVWKEAAIEEIIVGQKRGVSSSDLLSLL